MVHILALSLGLAHAGLFQWCVDRLIQDSPYQFEEVGQDYLEREVERLSIRVRWGRATAEERSVLSIMERELSKRAYIGGLPRQPL